MIQCLPRSYLGLFWAILNNFKAILETRAFQRAPAGWDHCLKLDPCGREAFHWNRSDFRRLFFVDITSCVSTRHAIRTPHHTPCYNAACVEHCTFVTFCRSKMHTREVRGDRTLPRCPMASVRNTQGPGHLERIYSFVSGSLEPP